ncbi:hypothetical protein DV517_64760 [Streptomyces sp. S816]|nr:hypothetical protein DV517_64760 [Streptomyces sp. S816]
MIFRVEYKADGSGNESGGHELFPDFVLGKDVADSGMVG